MATPALRRLNQRNAAPAGRVDLGQYASGFMRMPRPRLKAKGESAWNPVTGDQ